MTTLSEVAVTAPPAPSYDHRLHRIVATLPDGKRVKIARATVARCWARAMELNATRFIDSTGSIFERQRPGVYVYAGKQPKPFAVMMPKPKPAETA